MPSTQHVEILKKGVVEWNDWRKKNPLIIPDLKKAQISDVFSKYDFNFYNKINFQRVDLQEANLNMVDLRGGFLQEANLKDATLYGSQMQEANLRGANLEKANLQGSNLMRSNLQEANLTDTTLHNSNLSKANLYKANLSRANLINADLVSAHLEEANFEEANLSYSFLYGSNFLRSILTGANFLKSNLLETMFIDTDLSSAKNLVTCFHRGPSMIDHRTLSQSEELPLSFLRGCGLPDEIINTIPVLRGDPLQFYSCFISYSSKDEEFAKRLHADLQAKGIRCWFAPEDLKIGDKTRHAIDGAIRVHDKLLIIISENSINSDWVEHEVENGLEEEIKRKKTVLFPIRLDDTIMDSNAGWAGKIKRERNIGNFIKWKEHDNYQKSFERLVRDLKEVK